MTLKTLKNSRKLTQFFALGSLAGLLVYGAIARADKAPAPINPKPIANWIQQGNVKVKAQLSQHKVLQGSDGLIYIQVDMEAPEMAATLKKRKPTDFVVVLDRSGSMSGEKKMDYAIKAVESLVQQMSGKDRFALVTFDSIIETPVTFTKVSSDNKSQILKQVRMISPRGGTNLGGGLVQGIQLIKASTQRHNRAQRLILLSDGMANEGITELKELNKIAQGAVKGEFVISTIGVGLDFNETLLASLADHGTGHYHFLEQLAILDKVLAEEFYGASQIYAKQLQLKLNLTPGFEVVESSGYPIVRRGGTVTVQPGHLYSGQKKTFFVTLRAPTKSLYERKIGRVALSYQVNDKNYEVSLLDDAQSIACLPAEKKAEAHASINRGVYKEAWTKNNYGRFLKDSAGKVRKGDRSGALQTLKRYKAELGSAYAIAPSPAMKQQLAELEAMESEVNDAFSGADQGTKQKRFSKQKQAGGIAAQRK